MQPVMQCMLDYANNANNFFIKIEMQSIFVKRNLVDLQQELMILNQELLKLKNNELDYELHSNFIKEFFIKSPECLELIELWKFQYSQDIKEIDCVVVEIVGNIIHSSKMIGYRNVGTILVKTCIRECITFIYRNLNSGKHALIHNTLELLVAMVMHSTSTCRELAKVFNFTLKSIPSFLMIRNKKIEQDVRSLYIRFIFGFLINGDLGTRMMILGNKTIQNIFVDLKKDSVQVYYDLYRFKNLF